jgi:uncharacterized membrane protein YqhA
MIKSGRIHFYSKHMNPDTSDSSDPPGKSDGTQKNGWLNSSILFFALNSRYLFTLAVLGTGLIAIVLFLYGFLLSIIGAIQAIPVILHAVSGVGLDMDIIREYLAQSVEIIDIFLIATVFYLISLGFYELFIAKAPLPGWVEINNLDDLKTKLLALTVIALAVIFLGVALTLRVSTNIMEYGVAIAAMIAAISLYVWVKPH